MDGRAYWCEQCRHIFRLRVSRGLCPHCNTSSIKRYDNVEEEDYHRSSGILHSFFKLFGSPSESAAAAGAASNPYYPDFAMPLARWLFGEGPNPYPEHRVPPPRLLIDRSGGPTVEERTEDPGSNESNTSHPASHGASTELPAIKLATRHIKSSPSCAICQQDFKAGTKATILDCSHLFHTNCIITWLATNTTCPVCRKATRQSII